MPEMKNPDHLSMIGFPFLVIYWGFRWVYRVFSGNFPWIDYPNSLRPVTKILTLYLFVITPVLHYSAFCDTF